MPRRPLMEVRELGKAFRSGLVFRRRTPAVRDVSFTVESGRTLAVVGESGCGKTTLARLVAGLIPRNRGSVLFQGRDVADWPRTELRKQLQMVFQDADGSLNPTLTVRELLAEPARLHGKSKADAEAEVPGLLDMVSLTPDLLNRHPFELSGGQRQRIGLARAMSLEPALVIADEPVASLDRSVQAHILSMVRDFQKRLGVAYIYISHDLSTVRSIAHDMAVMLAGLFVETGPARDIFDNPAHPYTRLLVDAASLSAQTVQSDLETEELSSLAPGCPFTPLCPALVPSCARKFPPLARIGSDRAVRCFNPA